LLTIQPRDHLTSVFRFLTTKTIARLILNKRSRQDIRAYANERQGEFYRAIYNTYRDVPHRLRAVLVKLLHVMYPCSTYAPVYHDGLFENLVELTITETLPGNVTFRMLRKLTCSGPNALLVDANPTEFTLIGTVGSGVERATNWPLTRFESQSTLTQRDVDHIRCMRGLRLAVISVMSEYIHYNDRQKATDLIQEFSQNAIQAGVQAASAAVSCMYSGTFEYAAAYNHAFDNAKLAYERDNPCEYHVVTHGVIKRKVVLPPVPTHVTVQYFEEVLDYRHVTKLTCLCDVLNVTHLPINELNCVEGHVGVPHPSTRVFCTKGRVDMLSNVRDLTMRDPNAVITSEYSRLYSLKVYTSIPTDVLGDFIISRSLRVLHMHNASITDSEASMFDEVMVTNHDGTIVWVRLP